MMENSSVRNLYFAQQGMAALQAAILGSAATVDFFENIAGNTPAWVLQDNISSQELNTPNRVVRANQPPVETNLASPTGKRHILGVVGGNEISPVVQNPQDVESDLRGLFRPLTRCNERQQQAPTEGQEKVVINNRKTHIALDQRHRHLPEVQMWAQPGTQAPLPLEKNTCQQPQKY